MGLLTEVQDDLLELLGDELFGQVLVVDNVPVTALWFPLAPAVPMAGLPMAAVERYRLVAPIEALTVRVGQDLVIDGQHWMVLSVNPSTSVTDAVCERYA